jgi:hypothetical protein
MDGFGSGGESGFNIPIGLGRSSENTHLDNNPHSFNLFGAGHSCFSSESCSAGGWHGHEEIKSEFICRDVDTDNDGSMTKEEWKTAGLAEMPFTMCDSSKDGKVTTEEMAACALPEAMDANIDGILMVSEIIEFDKKMMGAPKKQYAATSPYVEGGATGMDFIKLFDADNDGKVTHMEWEKVQEKWVNRPLEF